MKLLVFFLTFIIFFSCNAPDNNQSITSSDSIATVESITDKIRKDPKNTSLLIQRAKLFSQNNQPENAINDLVVAISIDSLNPQIYYDLSEAYIKAAKSSKSKEWLEKALKLFPDSADVHIKLAQLHLFVKEYVKSMQYLAKAEELNNNKAEIYFLKGIIYKEMIDTTKALENFQIATTLNPDYYDAYILLGNILSARKDSNAVYFYKNAINVIPTSPEAHYNLGYYYQNSNNFEKAINEYYTIVNDIDSTYFQAYFNIGYINMNFKNDYKSAISFFTKAINHRSNYYEAFHNRGFCYEQLKNFSEAKNNYESALAIFPNYELSILGLNRIDKYK
ncbi:MAG: hypothetical protein A2046_10955 [Bacteroidetes bacterium GWA2_30_7]|nr:MAG: hypothetical protein A2046_10955 [Bacteroidetes bacterium GWA2_30_7]